MRITKIMTEHPMTIDMDTPLARIKWIFENHPFRHLLVTDDLKLVGVISNRDVAANLSPTVGTRKETLKDSVLLNKKAHQLMTHNPETLGLDADVFDVIKLFYKKKISCIPIVDDNQQPVGIVTTHDVFAVLYQQHLAARQKSK